MVCADARRALAAPAAPGLEQHHRRRRGQVEAGHARFHGDGDTPSGGGEQGRSQAAALPAEGEDRARGRAGPPPRGGRLRGRSATRGRPGGRGPVRRATGRAKCRPALPRTATGCQGSRSPVVSTAGGSGGGGDPHHGPEVPQVVGPVEEDHRVGAGGGQEGGGVGLRAAGQGQHRSGGGRPGPGAANSSGSHLAASRAGSARRRSGARPSGQGEDRLRVGGDRLGHRGAEAQGVLQGVEPLEHDLGGVAAGALVAGGAAGHALSLARRRPGARRRAAPVAWSRPMSGGGACGAFWR